MKKKTRRAHRNILRTESMRNLVGGLAQSEERNVSNVEAPGSKPGFSSGNVNFFMPAVLLHCVITMTPL